MTSAGALVRADAFRGRDALVSGPAGGVVGVAGVAEAAGGAAVLGFDMGGTSTDVCRYAGQLERRDTARVAGAKVRAPMLDVETVAAGGGSILHFDGLRARVGPDERRRRSGPRLLRPRRARRPSPTPTWCWAGSIRRRFPRCSARTAMRRSIRRRRAPGSPNWRRRWAPPSVEAAAEGFLAVAVEQMAGAIRRISTERGFDPRAPRAGGVRRRGGPGGLRRRRGARHPRGALPSLRQRALGLGHRPGADARRSGQRGWARRWTPPAWRRLRALAERLTSEAQRSARRAGRGGRRHRAPASTSATLEPTPPCPSRWASSSAVRAAFEAAHRRLFGFVEPDRPVADRQRRGRRQAKAPPPRGEGSGVGGAGRRRSILVTTATPQPATSSPVVPAPHPQPPPVDGGGGLIVRPTPRSSSRRGGRPSEEAGGLSASSASGRRRRGAAPGR